MKDTERHAINNLNNLLQNRRDNFTNQIKNNVQILVQGFNELDQNFKQKEQLLVQKERELDRLKSITDNSSKVARNIVNESKGNLDKATELLNSGNFNEALKYSDRALYNLEDIDNLGLQTIAQANNLYLERKQQYVDSASKRDYLYNSSVVNGVNAFGWVKDNPTRDFYTFFRETLNIPDKEQKSPDNVRIIKKLYELLPLYVEEAQRANYFYNEYNKYYDAMTKLQQVINIYNIKAASSKGLKDYEDALKSCEIALEIEPTSTTLVNLKNAILQAKQVEEASKLEENNLLVSKTQEIETLRELLAQKEVETQEKNKLLTQKGNELASTEKSLIEKHQKETEALKSLLAKKELEHQELLARKDKEVKELEKVKNELLKKELLEILPQAYPAAKGSGYNKPFTEWDPTWYGKKVLDAGNFKAIDRDLPGLREKAARIKEENLEKQAKELENAKRLQEENIKKEQLLANKDNVLSNKDKEIEDLKLLITQKENELVSTERVLIDERQKETEALKALLTQKELENQELLARKELEKQELLIQKEREKQELLLAKESEISDKSAEKNIVLRDKEKRIEELKALIEQSKIEKEELLAQKELSLVNKSHMKNQIIDGLRKKIELKENEVVDLKVQNLEKELITQQKEKLLIQKETEIQEKSFAKNQVIGDLQDDIDLKEKEALNLKIELLMKQVEFHKKESELKDKALEDVHEIVKQNKIINELQEKLLAFQNLSKHDETLKLELSVIHFKVEESIVNGNLDEMKELSKYLSQLMKDPIEKEESLEISELLNNLSPIVHEVENQVQNPLSVINNFDIDNQHITHSVLISGEDSFSIIKDDVSH